MRDTQRYYEIIKQRRNYYRLAEKTVAVISCIAETVCTTVEISFIYSVCNAYQ